MLGIDRSVRGVMVTDTRPAGDGPALLPFDVLSRVGGHAIDDEGMVRDERGLRLPFPYLIPQLERDGSVPVTVVREGQAMERSLPLRFGDNSLVPSYQGEEPPFFVCGPLVFSPARQEAIEIYFRVSPDLVLLDSPLATRIDDWRRFEGEELVVVTAPILPHPIARCYREPFGRVVRSVNGVAIRNLRHLVEALRDSEGPYLVFRFAEESSEILVFRRRELLDAIAEVMRDSGIPRRGSEGILAIWGESPTDLR